MSAGLRRRVYRLASSPEAGINPWKNPLNREESSPRERTLDWRSAVTPARVARRENWESEREGKPAMHHAQTFWAFGELSPWWMPSVSTGTLREFVPASTSHSPRYPPACLPSHLSSFFSLPFIKPRKFFSDSSHAIHSNTVTRILESSVFHSLQKHTNRVSRVHKRKGKLFAYWWSERWKSPWDYYSKR